MASSKRPLLAGHAEFAMVSGLTAASVHGLLEADDGVIGAFLSCRNNCPGCCKPSA